VTKQIKRGVRDKESDARPCCPKCGEVLERTNTTKEVTYGTGWWLERAQGVVSRLFVCPTGRLGHEAWRPEEVRFSFS
jgi:uncharacterized C2H2 Zn-finger protein